MSGPDGVPARPAVAGDAERGGGAVRVETHVLVDRQSTVTATLMPAREVSSSSPVRDLVSLLPL